MNINSRFDAACSDGEKLWSIDCKGVIYEISVKNGNVDILYWIEEIEDNDNHKFPVMCYSNQKLIIAPYTGQDFWVYDFVTKEAHKICECEGEAYLTFYRFVSEIWFVERTASKIAVYDCLSETIEKKELGTKNTKTEGNGCIRGGCFVNNEAEVVYYAIHGTNKILKINVADKSVSMENTRNMNELVLVHKIGNEIYYVSSTPEIMYMKNGSLIHLDMPEGAKRCTLSPFHYWMEVYGGLLLMPCDMNMVLFCKDGKVIKVCDSNDKFNALGRKGLFPGCEIKNGRIVGFPCWEDYLYEIDLKDERLKRQIFKLLITNLEINKLIKMRTETDKHLNEGEFGVNLSSFITSLH